MSTRANVKITDSFGDELWFYKHSDGYPESTMPTLEKFLAKVKSGKIRDNAMQASGWLVVMGNEEHKEIDPQLMSWKVGAYEPTTGIHGDIEYLYHIDLEKKTITVHNV